MMHSIEHETEYETAGIDVRLCEHFAEVFLYGKKLGTIGLKTNPYHNQHCYIALDFETYDLANAKTIFDILFEKIKKPLQVMISSEEISTISFLKEAGFLCKRKCYEVEAQKRDYIGGNAEEQLECSQFGESIYEKCRDLMLSRYISTHDTISPWTGTKEDFYNNLPDKVFYDLDDGIVKNFAFVEEAEIAYVYGTERTDFLVFSKELMTLMFKEYDTITFEADDCDEYAMILKSFFINQSNESFDTYILLNGRNSI